MKPIETIVTYFTKRSFDTWEPNIPEEITAAINGLSNPERRALRTRLFNEAKKLEYKSAEIDILNWLQNCFDTIDKYTFRMHHVYFSPGYDILDNLKDLIYRAKSTIDLCVFSITDDRLARAIKAAIKRGVKVRIITDDMKTMDRGSKIDWLDQLGIEVKTDQSRFHMHNKFGIIDHRMAFTGSFNWTKTATRSNQENLLITSNHSIVDQYNAEFERLWIEMHNY